MSFTDAFFRKRMAPKVVLMSGIFEQGLRCSRPSMNLYLLWAAPWTPPVLLVFTRCSLTSAINSGAGIPDLLAVSPAFCRPFRQQSAHRSP